MSRLSIYKGDVVDLGIETVDLPNGNRIELEVIRHPGAAAIVPLHADELPEMCARRELAEEVGLRCQRLDRISVIHTTPGFTDERIYIFLARDLSQGDTDLQPDEYLKPVRMPLAQAVQMVDDGDITDAKTICGLMAAHRRLRRDTPPAPG